MTERHQVSTGRQETGHCGAERMAVVVAVRLNSREDHLSIPELHRHWLSSSSSALLCEERHACTYSPTHRQFIKSKRALKGRMQGCRKLSVHGLYGIEVGVVAHGYNPKTWWGRTANNLGPARSHKAAWPQNNQIKVHSLQSSTKHSTVSYTL